MRNCIRIAMEAYRRVCRRRCSGTGASSSSTSSETSQRSKSTAPTIYSDHRSTSKQRAPVDLEDNDDDEVEEEVEVEVEEDDDEDDEEDDRHAVDPKDSASTYASTVPSEEEDIPEEEPRYQVFDRRPEFLPPDALSSNPRIFADLFPSSRRLLIRHDDTTLDGNMNLRVDTVVPHRYGYLQDVTLFHLRMYDLFSRKFSFRRYCRESGREVCHTERKKASSSGFDRRLSRSWSTALANIRAGSSGASPERNGETSSQEDEDVDARDAHDRPSTAFTDTTMLEFSNYAHVEVKRGISRNYEYEYWSTKYQWRREHRTEMGLQQIYYHLIDLQTSKAAAHLVPDILTPVEAIEEESKGGWVPPSSLWISDTSVYEKMSDVAE